MPEIHQNDSETPSLKRRLLALLPPLLLAGCATTSGISPEKVAHAVGDPEAEMHPDKPRSTPETTPQEERVGMVSGDRKVIEGVVEQMEQYR